MSTQGKTNGEPAGGKLVAGGLYIATLLIVLAFLAQSSVPFLLH